ncbi:MAG: hypothetical protein JSS40_02045, partial [Proteobacteria bacterium]|nr:hypothetical protein [Pseudomonadota bacterium]
LGANATLTGGGAINFGSTINGAQALTVNTTGLTTFGGAVGNTTALTSLTTDAGGGTSIDGGSVRTTGAQTYGDAIVLSQDTTITGAANTFNATITGPSTKALIVNDSGTTQYKGNVVVGSLTTDAPGQSNFFSGVTVTATGAAVNNLTPLITINDPITGGANVLLKTTNGGQVSIFNFATNPLSIDTTGSVQITGGGTVGGNSSSSALQLVTTPVNLIVTAPSVSVTYTAPVSPATLVFNTSPSVSVSAFLGGSTTSIAQKTNATTATALANVSTVQSSVSAAVAEASKVGFDTDSVAQQINYGFAGNVGVSPAFEHRLLELGISVPEGFGEDEDTPSEPVKPAPKPAPR